MEGTAPPGRVEMELGTYPQPHPCLMVAFGSTFATILFWASMKPRASTKELKGIEYGCTVDAVSLLMPELIRARAKQLAAKVRAWNSARALWECLQDMGQPPTKSKPQVCSSVGYPKYGAESDILFEEYPSWAKLFGP